MPKAKPDSLRAIRLELQESERETLDLVAGSLAIRNTLNGVGSLIRPITQMTPTGAIAIASMFAIYLDSKADSIENQLATDPTAENISTGDLIFGYLRRGTIFGMVDSGGLKSPRENADDLIAYYRAFGSKAKGFAEDMKETYRNSPF
jgi:hypothetical protein